MTLVSEALGDHHGLSPFASGQPRLDSWLAQHHGFRSIPGTMRLVRKLSDVAAALGG